MLKTTIEKTEGTLARYWIGTSSLHKNYNFSNGYYTECLLDADFIESFKKERFTRFASKTNLGDLIIHLAETCDADENLRDNFTVNFDGKIELGDDMAKIKEDIKKYEKKWNEYKNESAKIVTFEI